MTATATQPPRGRAVHLQRHHIPTAFAAAVATAASAAAAAAVNSPLPGATAAAAAASAAPPPPIVGISSIHFACPMGPNCNHKKYNANFPLTPTDLHDILALCAAHPDATRFVRIKLDSPDLLRLFFTSVPDTIVELDLHCGSIADLAASLPPEGGGGRPALRNLRFLTLTADPVPNDPAATAAALHALLQRTPHLAHLRTSRSDTSSPLLAGPRALRAIAACCPDLELLSAQTGRGVSAQDLDALMTAAPRLTSLHLSLLDADALFAARAPAPAPAPAAAPAPAPLKAAPWLTRLTALELTAADYASLPAGPALALLLAPHNRPLPALRRLALDVPAAAAPDLVRRVAALCPALEALELFSSSGDDDDDDDRDAALRNVAEAVEWLVLQKRDAAVAAVPALECVVWDYADVGDEDVRARLAALADDAGISFYHKPEEAALEFVEI